MANSIIMKKTLLKTSRKLSTKFFLLLALFVFSTFYTTAQTTINFNEITTATHLSLNASNTYDNTGVRFQIFSGSNSTAWVSSNTDGFEGTRALDDTNVSVGGNTGWKITKVDGSAFQLNSIWLQSGDVAASASGTIKAYKSGAQVGTTVNVTFNSSTAGAKIFSTNSDFNNIDEIRIEGSDLFILIDNFSFGSPVSANSTPVATAPTAPTVAEDAVNVALANNIQIADANNDNQTVTFTVTGGKVTLGTTGITFGGSGNGSASFTATGTLAAINTALDAATFTPTANLNGTNAGGISFVSNDGTVNSNAASVTFNISAVNDDPTVTGLPSSITINEDATDDVFDISSATISDIDAGSGALTLKLVATGGLFDVAAGTGITIAGHLTNELTLTGNLVNLNNYINIPTNIYFRPNANLDGNSAASVTVFINDNGNTGSGGGGDITVGTVSVNITGVNDDPTLTSLPTDITVDQNTASNVNLSAAVFADVDAGTNNVVFTITAGQGILSATSGGGVIIGGSGTSSLTLTGSATSIDTYLNAASNINYTGPVSLTGDNATTLTLKANDGGNTGTGGGTNVSLGVVNIDILKVITGITLADGNFTFNGNARSLAIAGTLPTGTSVSYLNNTRTGVGTQEVTATISGAGYATLVLTANLTINKANQTITFPALANKTTNDDDFDAGATASSGLAVSYTSSNSSVATIVGGKIHIVGVGTSTITAKQGGNTNFNAATDATQTLTVEAVLPVSLISFDAQLNNTGSVDLTWLTASEKSNSHFIVLHATDGLNFAQLAKIGGSGNSNQQRRYQTEDKNPANGNNYYQLVQYDTNGNAVILATKVVNVNLESADRITIFPNPAQDVVNVRFASGVFETVKLIDFNGRVLESKTIDVAQTEASFNITALSASTYIILLEGQGGATSKKLIKR